MDYDELVAKVIELLQREKRVPYRILKRRFELDDGDIEDLKVDLIEAKRVASDENDRILVWLAEAGSAEAPTLSSTLATPAPALPATEHEREPLSYTPKHLAEKILTSRSALEGERKQVTVLFCDLANSTPIAERIGPEHMHTLLNRFFELALSEVHRYEGTINQFLGDGFMALFGAPIAHEDHARRGVQAALALQHALKEADLGQAYGVECAFRMGLNSGLVVVGSIGDNLRMDYSAIGDTTNLASRLQAHATPGDILVSESTSRLVQGSVRLEALAPVEVKGKTEPVTPYKVIGTLPRRSPIVSRGERTLSPFVGRGRELATLEALFAQVEAGHGQVVGIVAEAGGGKSRLLYEFRQRLQDKRVTYLEGRCLSYGSSIPYHPLIDVLRHDCGISETESPDTIIAKVRLALHEVGTDAEDSVPYLLQLLGVQQGTERLAPLTPEAIRTRTFETLRQMSLQGSQQRPLIFEIEDLHWVDKTSETYLASLVESLPGAAILLLTSYRPGYRPPWLDKSYATQLSLHSLTLHDSATVVHSTSHNTTLPTHLEHMIIAKAEGNPFFLEELTRAVIEHSDSETVRDVPDTVQGVLMARIDRLPEEPKRLLQTASVLGREFSPRLLQAIWDGSGPLAPVLLELQRLEFLFARTGTEEPTYVFTHALTQDVAYASLLTTRRQRLHTMAGQALEHLYADRLEDAYDRLTYHYARTDQAAKAVEYLTLVAQKAAKGYAHAEAIALLQEALAHAEQVPEADRDRCVLDVAVRQAESLYWAGRRQELVVLLRGQHERLARLQEPELTGTCELWLGVNYSLLGEREPAAQCLQRALEAGAQCRNVAMMGKARAGLALDLRYAGAFQHSIVHAQQAVSLLEGTAERFWLGMSLYFLGRAYYQYGNFPAALATVTRLQALGETTGDRRLQVNGLQLLGVCATAQGDWEAGIAACQRALASAPADFETAVVLGNLGYAYLEQGNLAKAIPLLETAAQQACQYQVHQIQSQAHSLLGEAYHLEGHLEQAQDVASQGLAIAQDIKFLFGVGLAQRTLGRIAHTSGSQTEAEHYFQDAMETFLSIAARYEFARTYLDCATLAHTQGNKDAATTHLSTAYAWFKTLQVPKWVERTEQLAHEYGIPLKEVTLEEVPGSET